ncbi:MAG TPA: DMT family transporter [Patescibacteria group bacterium]|nr:DMT family transporter [Patescibacteria group bacterium]
MGNFKIGFADWILLLVAFIWGVNAPVMKVGLLSLSPIAYNALRMLVSIVFAWVFLYFSHTYRPFARQDYWLLLKISFWGFFFFQLFFSLGLNQTTAGNASLILGLLTVSVAVINRMYSFEVLEVPTVVGIVVSLAGVFLIILGSGKELSLGDNHLTGGLLLFVAQFAYAYYTVFSRPLLEKYSAYQLMAYLTTASGLMFLAVAVPDLISISWAEVPAAAWSSVVFSGAFGICIGNALWVWGVKRLGSTKAALYNNLPPVFAVLTGCLFLGESFGLLQFTGAAVIFFGLYITRTKGGFLQVVWKKEKM